MYINFNEYEMLELFESDPVVIGQYEAGNFIYSKTDEFGFKLVFTISIYENECIVSLSHQSYKTPIVDYRFKDVVALVKNEDCLILKRNNNEELIKVFFKPNFSFSFPNTSNDR
ncbi:hypothetical protein GMD78_02810 [Ornithinibacillus sp. L9]|uniref:Uncharacterized protein n=1 Tax=Ornithinibacillus caprae TaxID=2678566 RepID=A0A6N8FDR3_9BACI|nr:hypothetical protein [Ornithinibacillus caprae]MUK87331.1 hypothetical protein [Ornithinibacillus caprae]